MNNSPKVIIRNNINRTGIVEYHFHLHYEILYVKSGVFTLCFDGKSTDVLPGELCIIPPLTAHKTIYDNTLTDSIIFEIDYLSYYISRDALNSIESFGKKILFISKSEDNDSPKHLFERIIRFGGEGAYIQILMMLKKASRDNNKKFLCTNNSLYNVISCINSCYLEKLSLENISSICNISRFHICRLMKQHMGITPVDYITFLKIRQAVLWLKETNHTVTKISENLCFSSPKYFTKIFRSYLGISPGEFRKNTIFKAWDKYCLHKQSPDLPLITTDTENNSEN